MWQCRQQTSAMVTMRHQPHGHQSMVFVSDVWAAAKLVRKNSIVSVFVWELRGKWFLVLGERHPKTIILSVNVPDMKCKLPETPMYTKTQNRLGLRELSNAVRAAECPWVSEYWIVLSGSEEKKEVSPDNWWCLLCPGPTSPATRTRPPWPGWATGSWAPLTCGCPASASGPRH